MTSLPHWNYRVVRHKCPKSGECYLAVHEVYYDAAGNIQAWHAEPETVTASDDLRELRSILQMMLNACDNANLRRRPERRILDEKEMPK